MNETNDYKQIVQRSTTCPKVTKFITRKIQSLYYAPAGRYINTTEGGENLRQKGLEFFELLNLQIYFGN